MTDWLKGKGFNVAWLVEVVIIFGAGFYLFGALSTEVTNLKESSGSYARKDVLEPMFKNVDDKFLSLHTSLDDKFRLVDTNIKHMSSNIQKVESRMAGIDRGLTKILTLLAEK